MVKLIEKDKRMRLLKNEKLYLEIINNIQDGVYFVDRNRNIMFWNKGAENITGYEAKEMIGKNCDTSNLNHIDDAGHSLCQTSCPLLASIIDGEKRESMVFVRHKNGHRKPIRVYTYPMKHNGEIIGGIEIFSIKSPTVYDDCLIDKLSNIALNDQLTDLPNRRKIESFLNYSLGEAKRFNKLFCVVFMDIDNFRVFNNTYGHEIGDLVLKNVSLSIKHSLRKNDLFGRWGGEEFLGVFEIQDINEGLIVGEKIRTLVESTQIINKDSFLSVTASIGVSIFKEDDNIESIVNRADELMFTSKQQGKNRVTSEK